MLKDLRETNENESMGSQNANRRMRTNRYTERIQHRHILRISNMKHGQIHSPFEFAFYPGDFGCDPPKIIAPVSG